MKLGISKDCRLLEGSYKLALRPLPIAFQFFVDYILSKAIRRSP